MNFYRLIIAVILCAGLTWAGEKPHTPFYDEYDNGGFGGPMLQITKIMDKSAILFGGRGGWIIDHRFVLGGAGYGLVSDVVVGTDCEGPDAYLHMGYGGAWLEFVLRPRKIMHISLHALLGGGGLHLSDDENKQDSFYVAEPGVTMTLNLARFIRIGAGVCYRFVSGLDKTLLRDSDLAGMGCQFFIGFGRF